MINFYPRPPRGGRRLRARLERQHLPISIHALREEGDGRSSATASTGSYFYPRPPRGGRPTTCGRRSPRSYFYPRPPRGGRPASPTPSPLPSRNFYPRPPRGGRRKYFSKGSQMVVISIHALREEGDLLRPHEGDRHITISIHALREEGDNRENQYQAAISGFLSTPSARRATQEQY